MSETVILIGGGGHAKVVMECVRQAGDRVVGILDDALEAGTTVLDVPVLGKISNYLDYTQHKFCIAIGNNDVRQKIAGQLNVNWHTAIHPSAVVSRYAKIGAGTVIMPGAVVNPGAVIGNHCIVNSGAVVEHDNTLEDFVHISPKAVLGGTVRIGEQTHIGIGAVVKNNLNICGGCTVGAGAVVVKNITQAGTYVGVPARSL